MGYIEELLGDNERIIFSTRQHKWVLAQAILLDIVLTVLLIAGTLYFQHSWIALGLLLPLAHLAWKTLEWKSRLYLVTNRRIIELEGILSKRSTDSSLDKINDVILTQSLWGRMFNFGDIEVLTASEEGINLLRHIANPLEFKKQMLNQKESLRDEDHFAASPSSPTAASPNLEDIPRLIQELDALRQQGLLTDAEFNAKKRELLARL